MPLAKKLSKLFRHEKGEKDSVVTTIRPVDPNPLSPVYEAEAAPATTTTQDDDYIIAATQASLEDEISRLEAHVQNQTNQLSRQEHANSRARQEISSLNERLASASAENSTLRASTENVRVMLSELVNESSRLRVELQAKANELGTEREEKARLQRENSALQVDMKALYDNLQSFENTKPQIMAMFNEQARKSRDLEQRLSYALQPMNDDARRTFEERIAWVNERAELENRFQAEKSEMTKQIDTLRRHVDMKEEQCVRVEARASAVQARLEEQEAAVAAITADLEEERAMHRDAKEIIQALQVSEQNMHEEFSQTQSRLTQLLSMFGTDPTPRQVLYLEHHVKKFPRARGEATVGDNTVFSRTHVFEDLTTNDLNAPLSETDFATFIQSAITSSTNDNGPRRIGFKRCHECHRHKIIALSNQSSPNLGEFPKEYAREYRCSSSICKECLLNKLKSSITQDWWYNLDSDQWLKCPIAGCDHALNIRLTEELPDLLDDYTLREIAEVKQV